MINCTYIEKSKNVDKTLVEFCVYIKEIWDLLREDDTDLVSIIEAIGETTIPRRYKNIYKAKIGEKILFSNLNSFIKHCYIRPCNVVLKLEWPKTIDETNLNKLKSILQEHQRKIMDSKYYHHFKMERVIKMFSEKIRSVKDFLQTLNTTDKILSEIASTHSLEEIIEAIAIAFPHNYFNKFKYTYNYPQYVLNQFKSEVPPEIFCKSLEFYIEETTEVADTLETEAQKIIAYSNEKFANRITEVYVEITVQYKTAKGMPVKDAIINLIYNNLLGFTKNENVIKEFYEILHGKVELAKTIEAIQIYKENLIKDYNNFVLPSNRLASENINLH